MNLLLIGCGFEQSSIIKCAHDLKIDVFGLDGRAEAEGRRLCKDFEQCDIMNPDAVEQVALKLNKQYGIDGVMCPAVEAGISTGRVVDKLGLLGIGEKTATNLTDKILRRVALDELGIPQPRWGYRDEKKAGEWKIFPAVVKPRIGSAARGVRLVHNTDEVGLNYDYLEEYLEGWELSVEVLVFDNGIKMVAAADRNYDKKHRWTPYLIEDGCQFPSKIGQNIHKKINTLVDKLIRGFGLVNCAIKLDLLVKDNVVYVIEVAPRLGGGKLSSVMISMATGINWWKIAMKLALGVPIDQKDIQGTRQLFTSQRYRFPEKVTSHRDRLESFEASATTYEEAIKKAEDLVRDNP